MTDPLRINNLISSSVEPSLSSVQFKPLGGYDLDSIRMDTIECLFDVVALAQDSIAQRFRINLVMTNVFRSCRSLPTIAFRFLR